MQLKTDENGAITSFVLVGTIGGGVEVDDSLMPDAWTSLFRPGEYMYKDGTIAVNPDFKAPDADYQPSDGPSNQDQINAMLTKQLAAATKTAETAQSAAVALTKQLAAQAKEA